MNYIVLTILRTLLPRGNVTKAGSYATQKSRIDDRQTSAERRSIRYLMTMEESAQEKGTTWFLEKTDEIPRAGFAFSIGASLASVWSPKVGRTYFVVIS